MICEMICGKCTMTITNYLVRTKYLENFSEIRDTIADSLDALRYEYNLLIREKSRYYPATESVFERLSPDSMYRALQKSTDRSEIDDENRIVLEKTDVELIAMLRDAYCPEFCLPTIEGIIFQLDENASKTRAGKVYSQHDGILAKDWKKILRQSILLDFCQCSREEKGDESEICLCICKHEKDCQYYDLNYDFIQNAYEIKRRKGKFFLVKRRELVFLAEIVVERRFLEGPPVVWENKWGNRRALIDSEKAYAQIVGYIFCAPSTHSLPQSKKFTKLENVKSFVSKKCNQNLEKILKNKSI